MAKKQQAAVNTKVRINPKIILGIAIGPLLCVVVWMFFTSPAKAQAEETATTAATEVDKDAALNARLTKLQSGTGSQAALLLSQSRQLDLLLPTSSEAVAAADSVINAARSSGVEIKQLNPSGAPTTPGAAPAPGAAAAPDVAGLTASTFAVQVSGSPTAVTRFFDELSRQQRLVTVSQASITTGSTATAAAPVTSGAATATATVSVWSFSAPTLAQEKPKSATP